VGLLLKKFMGFDKLAVFRGKKGENSEIKEGEKRFEYCVD